MYQPTTLELQRRGKPLSDSPLIIRLRDRLYPLLITLAGTKVKYKVNVLNDYCPISGKSIIFAGNHSAFLDAPIISKATRRRSCVLAGKQNLAWIDWLFFVLNGVMWVDRQNKDDMVASKTALVEHLKLGESILWCPEGTWNLTPNQLIMPMKWGIIDVAHKAEAQIIPIVLDYDREKLICQVKFGVPIAGPALEDKAKGIQILRDAMATLRWELLCNKPVLHRAEVDPVRLKVETERAIDEYPPLDWEYESSCIYHPKNHVSSEVAFEHLQHLIPCKENAFLLRRY